MQLEYTLRGRWRPACVLELARQTRLPYMRRYTRLGSTRDFFLRESQVLLPDVDRVSFGVRTPLAMILVALERGDAQLSPGSNQVEFF